MSDKADVLAWIKAHPDLLVKHPELLDDLVIPHDCGATSLIEHQLARLRRKNRQLDEQLAQLAGIAGENERLMQRLHQLTLEVLTTTTVSGFVAQLRERLIEDFQADQVRLLLDRAIPSLREIEGVEIIKDCPDWLGELIDNQLIVCGRLTRAKLGFLFAGESERIASAAVVPIGDFGVLAIGATAPDRFHPHTGTLFLELLGITIRHRMDHEQRNHRKTA